MELEYYYSFNIAESYLSALINGDWSGLDEVDTITLKEFLDELTQHIGNSNFRWNIPSYETQFELCEVCDFPTNTVNVNLYRY